MSKITVIPTHDTETIRYYFECKRHDREHKMQHAAAHMMSMTFMGISIIGVIFLLMKHSRNY